MNESLPVSIEPLADAALAAGLGKARFSLRSKYRAGK